MRDLAAAYLRAQIKKAAMNALGVGRRRFGMIASKLTAFDVSDLRALPLDGAAQAASMRFMIGWSDIGGEDSIG